MIEAKTVQKQSRWISSSPNADGETAILYKLKVGEIVTIIPTISFNVETVENKNIKDCSHQAVPSGWTEG